mgnify:CR=1 FL=1
MTQVTESGGRQNIYSIEPTPQVDKNYAGYPEEAEKTNGRWAMLGIVALFWCLCNNRSNYPRYILMTKSKALEKQKILAEKWNGRLAMIGLMAAATSDLLTGHMFFGIF